MRERGEGGREGDRGGGEVRVRNEKDDWGALARQKFRPAAGRAPPVPKPYVPW